MRTVAMVLLALPLIMWWVGCADTGDTEVRAGQWYENKANGRRIKIDAVGIGRELAKQVDSTIAELSRDTSGQRMAYTRHLSSMDSDKVCYQATISGGERLGNSMVLVAMRPLEDLRLNYQIVQLQEVPK